jgi:hypothetical protein
MAVEKMKNGQRSKTAGKPRRKVQIIRDPSPPSPALIRNGCLLYTETDDSLKKSLFYPVFDLRERTSRALSY